MRFTWLFGGLAVLVAGVVADSSTSGPDVQATATFPDDNPFGQIVNGEKNKINIFIENKSEMNVSLSGLGGSFHDVESGALLKNTSAMPYIVPLFSGVKITIPYTFHSEFKPRDARLHIWADYTVEGSKYRVTAYDSTVTIVEPELSIFDLKLLSTYLILISLIGGGAYFTYHAFFPAKRSKPSKASISKPVNPLTPTPTSQGTYEEEWIPAHHLKKAKKDGALSSGDESAGEKKRGKKRA